MSTTFSMGTPLFPLRDDEAKFAVIGAGLLLLQEGGYYTRLLVGWGSIWVAASRYGLVAKAIAASKKGKSAA